MTQSNVLGSTTENYTEQEQQIIPSFDKKSRLALPKWASELTGGLWAEAYTHPDFLELERQTLFTKYWICVGLASDVSQPGDLRPVDVAGMPLVLVRDRQGTLRAFHNICSHRGLELVDQPCHGKGMIRCPYHSWTYGLDGALKSTPHFGGYYKDSYEGFDRAAKGLRAVRCEQWLDMVFVNLSGDAPPLDEYLKPITDRWADYDLSLLRRGRESTVECNANWKLAVENFSESYHLAWVHPTLNSLSRMEDHFWFDVGETHVGQGSLKYYSGELAGKRLPTFPNLEATERTTVAEYVSVFPNLMLGVHPDYFLVFMVNPLSPDRSLERMIFYFVGDEAMTEDNAPLRDVPVDLWIATNDEDIEVIERMQKGRRSPAFDGGCFSPALENTVKQFQNLIFRAINA
ncbi:MAG: aromatic ring-hydroxylating dioxygenase subunit alpha [Leptolyngbyaceae bacterium]|nr:aromatic ring-hydroxylating dioxygenase subunit alpha [Leptolyngbyaceae bacterium]